MALREVVTLVIASAAMAGFLPRGTADDPVGCESGCATDSLPVAFALVARDPAKIPGELSTALEAARHGLLAPFQEATGGRLALHAVGGVATLPAPDGDLASAPATLARAYFADPQAPHAAFLVLVAVDVPLASPACRCESWAAPARADDAPLAMPAPSPAAFGAPAGFRGVIGLGTVADLADVDDLAFRLLHEAGHAWCCAPPAGHALQGSADGTGHWSSGAPADAMTRGARVAKYGPATLAAMGLDP